MKLSSLILRGSIWTIAAYGSGQFLRFATNAALTRLLAPELFGIMTIVNSIKTGLALLTDAGVAQNVIVNQNAENPEFYNTAWTINVIRGLAIWVLCVVGAVPFAHFYDIEALVLVLPISALVAVSAGLTSMAPALLQRQLKFKRFNAFELITDALGFAGLLIWAAISPTIWALVLGGFVASAARLIGSYMLIPGIRHRLYISGKFAWQILVFSKWIFISSIAFFFSLYLDRLYLGKVFPLALLGVYGLARALAEPMTLLVSRLGTVIIFPMIASASDTPRPALREHLTLIRLLFLLATTVGLSLLAAHADLLVHLLYDQRYQEAGWMATILMAGAWFSILCNLNESTLLGFGKPSYGAVASSLKLVWLIVGLPLSFAAYGPLGAVIAVGASDLFRYAPIFVGQKRARFAFGVQDLALTILFFGLIALWQWLRYISGISFLAGSPFAQWF